MMEAKIISRSVHKVVIEWSGETGSGRIELEYNDKGGYMLLDAEYIGFDTLFSIIRALEL